ncbi:MAG TPA: ABC transporter permease subunit [Solirubrobacteraceae bacterium]|nr:ABC transporter permease subunit [Solirubrobacteraceae bacterium]
MSALRGAPARRTRNVLPTVLLIAALLGAWELYADLSGVQEDVLPAPHAVASALWSNWRPVWRNFTVTAEQVLLGLALALACGFVLAVAIHLLPLLRRAVYPLAVGSQAVPIPVIGVPLVLWWGFGIFPKLVVIALICFFPVVVATVDGLAAVDPEQPKLLRTLDASRWQAFRFAELPAALPAALSGARIALAVGVIGAFIAETSTPSTTAYSGLGREIVTNVSSFQTPRAYAATAVLFAFAVACFYALALVERMLIPWRSRPRGWRA